MASSNQPLTFPNVGLSLGERKQAKVQSEPGVVNDADFLNPVNRCYHQGSRCTILYVPTNRKIEV